MEGDSTAMSARSSGAGDAGVGSSVVAFLVAGVLFMGSIAAVLVTTRTSSDEGSGDASDAAAALLQADSLARILLGSPGSSESLAAGSDWSDDANYIGRAPAADQLSRLGLLDAGSELPSMMNFSKFQNLRAAPLASSSTDGLVNYEDARRMLGLADAGIDFHVRAYPALQDVDALLACQAAAARAVCKDPNLKVAYIGDIRPPSASSPPSEEALATQLGNPTITCSVSPQPKAYRVASTVVNGGSASTQFRGVFDVRFSDGPRYTKTVNSPVLAPGQSITFTLDVPAYNGRACGAGTDIEFDLYDANDRLLTVEREIASPVTGAAASPKDLWVESATYFLAGSPMKVTFDGSAPGNGFKNQPFTFVLHEGEGTSGAVRLQKAVSSTANGKGGDIALDPATPLAPGVYTAVLYDGSFATPSAAASSSAVRVSARVNVVSAAPGPYVPSSGAGSGSAVYVPEAVVETEVHLLDTIVQQFCPTYWNQKDQSPLATAPSWDSRCGAFKNGTAPFQPGDVFPDAKNPLRDGLVPRLICQQAAGCPGGQRDGSTAPRDAPRYDLANVVVVGSNVDHNEMAPAEVKYALEDWVKGGGTLVVLGSIDQSVNWLMPILKTGIKSSSGGVSVPDAAHPVLHVPDELAYADYEHGNQVWDFRGSHEANELFTQVVAQGSATEFEPILAVSNPGAIQNTDTGSSGTVILTTWQAWDVFRCPTCSDANRVMEGLKFVNNILMLGYGDLYLDYGPPIPPDTNVVPAIRFAQIQHPDFAEPIQMKMTVFVFG